MYNTNIERATKVDDSFETGQKSTTPTVFADRVFEVSLLYNDPTYKEYHKNSIYIYIYYNAYHE